MQQTTIAFGPAGNSASFYAQGFKRTQQSPAWLAALGLSAMEYPSGRGIMPKEETAREIGQQAAQHGILVSLHAPYFINLANPDPERYVKNRDYILSSARTVDWMGGDRVILHVGSSAKRDREEALSNVLAGLKAIRAEMMEQGLGHIRLCPETMGRDNQLGTLEDVLRICELDESFLPNIDFAHLHARGRGALLGEEDFESILTAMISALGFERVQHFHSHFCRIEYTGAGEKRHHTFADTEYGPDFAHLAPCLVRHGLKPRIICESSGTMAEDAVTMRDLYRKARKDAGLPDEPS